MTSPRASSESDHPEPGWALAAGLVSLSAGPLRVPPELRDALAARVHSLALALDEGSDDGLRDCLTADVVWSETVRGHRSLASAAGIESVVATIGRTSRADVTQSRRLFLNVMVTAASQDEAVLQACLLHTITRAGTAQLLATGVQRFHFERHSDRWLIRRVDTGWDGDPDGAPDRDRLP